MEKKAKATKTKQKRRTHKRTIELDEIVLSIDSNHDPVTKTAYFYREKHVYPFMQSKGFTVDKCQGTFARRTYVAPKARRENVVYLTGVGHGSYRTYTGHFYDPIFDVGNYTAEESEGKIVHFLSCQTGRELGPDFVNHGCRAYFGYDENFVFIMADSDVFFACDSEIDRAFAEGLTAKDVYARTKKLYESNIAKLRAAGKHYTAATLETDLDRLRCPSSGGSEWGNEKAKL